MTKELQHAAASTWDRAFEATKWFNRIPYINWPHSWKVKAVPPFGGVLIRYAIKKQGLKDCVSVYLDGYSMLGHYGQPYWEVYPYNDATFRCAMEDTKRLLNAIRISLRQLQG